MSNFREMYFEGEIEGKGLLDEIDRLRVEADSLRKDAERYRCLRRKVAIVGGDSKAEFRILNLNPRYVAPKASIELDAAIDAAMIAKR